MSSTSLSKEEKKMNFERQDKIIKAHPNLFSYPSGRLFEIGDGWLDIIENLADKLEPLIVEFKRENSSPDDECPAVSKIKEKYGTLRFYMTTETVEMSDLITEAEVQSSTTCEQCGKHGFLRGEFWYYVACNECEEKKDKKDG